MPTSRNELSPNAIGTIPTAVLRRKTAGKTITIYSRADIDFLFDLARRFRVFGGAPLVLAIPGLTSDRKQHFESQLNAAWSACGCAEGAIAAMFAIVVAGVAGLYGVETYGIDVLLRAALFMVIALFLGGLLGKFAGLALANLRLRRILSELSKYTSSPCEPELSEKET